LPGPALLRIRQDVYSRLQFPGTHVVAEEGGKVHLEIDEDRRGDGFPVPVEGVVFLREGDDEFRMERVDPREALPDLWTLNFKLPMGSHLATSFDGMAALADAVPVWNLYRRLEFDTLPSLVDRIITRCLS
jgi:hypothetical protein